MSSTGQVEYFHKGTIYLKKAIKVRLRRLSTQKSPRKSHEEGKNAKKH